MDRVRRLVHDGAAIYDGSFSGPPSPATRSADRTWTHTGSRSDPGAHAVEFSKTAAPCREGDSFSRGATRREQRLARTAEYSAQPARPPTGRRVAWRRVCGRGTVAHRGRWGTARSGGAGRGPERHGLEPPRARPAAPRRGPSRPRRATAYDRTCTDTIRSRARSSKSSRTTCCQVPSPSSPPTIGIVSLGPMSAARRWLWALVSLLSSLWE
jgi:hypothetical protein